MTQSTVTCPHCGQQDSMAAHQVGQTVQCTRCGKPFVAGTAMSPLPTPQYGYPQLMPGESNGMAIASLVCGLVLCVPFAWVLAIIFGILGINRAKQIGGRGKGMAIAGIILGAVYLPLMITVLLPALIRARAAAIDLQSLSNENQISVFLTMYEQQFDNLLPPSLGDLASAGIMNNPQVLLSPRSQTTVPANWSTMTPIQRRDWINANSDYVLLFGNEPIATLQSKIILYEKQGARGQRGVNVLHGDGSANLENPKVLQTQVDQMKAATN
jgi:ribosomal protein S27AE